MVIIGVSKLGEYLQDWVSIIEKLASRTVYVDDISAPMLFQIFKERSCLDLCILLTGERPHLSLIRVVLNWRASRSIDRLS
jgi:hypothetical protein